MNELKKIILGYYDTSLGPIILLENSTYFPFPTSLSEKQVRLFYDSSVTVEEFLDKLKKAEKSLEDIASAHSQTLIGNYSL